MAIRLAYTSVVLALIALPAVGAEKAHHWSYAGSEGPSHWGGICAKGKAQSPIDIRSMAAKSEQLPPLTFDYRPGPLRIIDNGHSVQVNVEPGSSLTVGADHYDLVQFHFHKPSEETIDGRHYAMVAHLVHRNAKGDLAVVAVLLKAGADNPLIDQFWRNIPGTKEHEETLHAVSISPAQLLPANRSYFTYHGSLTTPPCTEGVRWFVLRTPTAIGLKQIVTFGKLYQMNARPVQPLDKREVLASK